MKRRREQIKKNCRDIEESAKKLLHDIEALDAKATPTTNMNQPERPKLGPRMEGRHAILAIFVYTIFLLPAAGVGIAFGDGKGWFNHLLTPLYLVISICFLLIYVKSIRHLFKYRDRLQIWFWGSVILMAIFIAGFGLPIALRDGDINALTYYTLYPTVSILLVLPVLVKTKLPAIRIFNGGLSWGDLKKRITRSDKIVIIVFVSTSILISLPTALTINDEAKLYTSDRAYLNVCIYNLDYDYGFRIEESIDGAQIEASIMDDSFELKESTLIANINIFHISKLRGTDSRDSDIAKKMFITGVVREMESRVDCRSLCKAMERNNITLTLNMFYDDEVLFSKDITPSELESYLDNL